MNGKKSGERLIINLTIGEEIEPWAAGLRDSTRPVKRLGWHSSKKLAITADAKLHVKRISLFLHKNLAKKQNAKYDQLESATSVPLQKHGSVQKVVVRGPQNRKKSHVQTAKT